MRLYINNFILTYNVCMYVCMYECMCVWTKCTLEFKNMYVCMCVGESDSGEQEAEGGGVLPAAHGKGRQP